jgi:glycosyltransferase involved in cell wall biosynthesis
VPGEALVLGFSGGLNLLTGVDWLIEAVQDSTDLHAILQPLGADDLTRFLLSRLRHADRFFVETRRLDWQEAWSQAAAFDVGVAIYHHSGPQFQLMGTSSNRLCMYLAMGVPVIASRQPSFEFLERYDCGVLVASAAEFRAALTRIGTRREEMSRNARHCWDEYVNARGRYATLQTAVGRLLRVRAGDEVSAAAQPSGVRRDRRRD